jgi:hypothetical protein
MVHTPRSPGWYSLPSRGEPQMCRRAYGVPANMTIVPPSPMTVPAPRDPFQAILGRGAS